MMMGFWVVAYGLAITVVARNVFSAKAGFMGWGCKSCGCVSCAWSVVESKSVWIPVSREMTSRQPPDGNVAYAFRFGRIYLEYYQTIEEDGTGRLWYEWSKPDEYRFQSQERTARPWVLCNRAGSVMAVLVEESALPGMITGIAGRVGTA